MLINFYVGYHWQMPGGYIIIGGGVYDDLKIAVKTRAVSQDAVDRMARRFISAWFKVEQDKVTFTSFILCLIQAGLIFVSRWYINQELSIGQ